MNRKLLALYGLKFNPFAPELPTEALWIAPEVENFMWRIQFALVREGGFALITGESGSGKSVTLRLLSERLAAEPDLVVGAICWATCETDPQATRKLTPAETRRVRSQNE